MRYITHMLGGVAISTGIILLTKSSVPVVEAQSTTIMLGGALGGLMPDIDHTESKISRQNIFTNMVSMLVSKLARHRGVVHTPIAMLIITIVLGIIADCFSGTMYSYFSAFCIGLIPGFFSHLVLDTLNPSGIMWGYPISKKYYSIMSIKTGSIYEILVMIVLFGVVLLMFF